MHVRCNHRAMRAHSLYLIHRFSYIYTPARVTDRDWKRKRERELVLPLRKVYMYTYTYMYRSCTYTSIRARYDRAGEAAARSRSDGARTTITAWPSEKTGRSSIRDCYLHVLFIDCVVVSGRGSKREQRRGPPHVPIYIALARVHVYVIYVYTVYEEGHFAFPRVRKARPALYSPEN